MPNFDGTGPMGKGPLIGKGRRGCRKTQSVQGERPGTQPTDARNIFQGLYRKGRLNREDSGRGRNGRLGRIKKDFVKNT